MKIRGSQKSMTMTGDNLKVSVDQNTSQIDVKRNGESPTNKG